MGAIVGRVVGSRATGSGTSLMRVNSSLPPSVAVGVARILLRRSAPPWARNRAVTTGDDGSWSPGGLVQASSSRGHWLFRSQRSSSDDANARAGMQVSHCLTVV